MFDLETSLVNIFRKFTAKKHGESLYVYTPGMGRFGNLIFEYASIMGIANYTKRQVLFGKQMSNLQYVFPRLKVSTLDDTPLKWKRLVDNVTWDFNENLLKLGTENVTIEGHMCSFRYFENISSWLYKDVFSHMNRGLVLSTLHFIRHIKQDYQRHHSGIKPSTVCVHVRRGDKATTRANYWGYRLPEPEDIIFAIDYMKKELNHSVFIVSSDSKQWCLQNLARQNIHISRFTLDFKDFVLMSSCDHMIMTVGTFGWWAAWLTSQRGGTVMYYNHPFVSGSFLDSVLDRNDHFLPRWMSYNRTSVNDTLFSDEKGNNNASRT